MALTMIDPTSSWFEIAELWFEITELPVIIQLLTANKIFDKTLDCIAKLVNKIWLSRYPWCRYLMNDKGSEFKIHFKYLCKSYGIKHKPTTVKNPQANGILECVHQVLGQMLRTAEIDMANSVTPYDINVFLGNAAWEICSTYHMVLKTSPSAAIFGQYMSLTFHLWLTGTKLENTGNH
jgi:hypothetical protein